MATKGMPTYQDIQTCMQYLEQWVQSYRLTLGVNPYAADGTAVAAAQEALERIVGDGTSAKPGISASELQRQLILPLGQLVQRTSYVDFGSSLLMPIVQTLDQAIRYAWPDGWAQDGRPLDAWLRRSNATHPSTPPAPSSAPTLTAVPSGALPTCSAGNAPSVYYTHVYQGYESPPSPPASGVAISGRNSAYQVSISGTVPSGVSAVRIYRTPVGAPGASPLYVGEWSVTAGASYPTIVLGAPDSELRYDIVPPSYCGCMLTPGQALLYAMAYSVGGRLVSTAMAHPTVVAAAPATGWWSIAHTDQLGVLAYRTGTSFTSGAYSDSNQPDYGVPGVYGARTLRVRVTSTLSGATSISSIGYTYRVAGTYTPASASIAGPISLSAAVGSTASIPIPEGRVVVAITGDTCGITSGTYIYEAAP